MDLMPGTLKTVTTEPSRRMEDLPLRVDIQQRDANRTRMILAAVAVVLFLFFAVATFMGWEKACDVESPFLSLVMASLIFICVKTAGKYESVAACFFFGMVVWLLADILWAVISVFSLDGNEVLSNVSDNLYQAADYISLLAIIFYARIVFKKSDHEKIAVNAFVVAIVTTLFGYRYSQDYRTFDGLSFELVELMLYFFVSVFSIMIIGMVLAKTGLKGHNPAFYLLFISLFVFNVLEIRYTYMMMRDKEPESVYCDVLYYLCLLLYSFAWIRFDIGEWHIQPRERVTKRDKYVPWINSGLIVIVTAVLYAVGYFENYMVFIMVITALAYIIMCKTVQANALAEELLKRQKSETERLEQMVAEKIKELQEMNDHLEYISNTDALTGLYNRRYGLQHLDRLVRNGEDYPIALYSIDLNYFKPINDNYGHDMGDVVLREVGARLNSLGQERCTSIRVGGDEFLVVFQNATNDAAIHGIGNLICHSIDEPIDATVRTEDGEEKFHSFIISASIGIAVIPWDADNIDDIYKMADEALYTVKHTSEKSSYLMYRNMEAFKKELEQKEDASGEISESNMAAEG